MESSQQRRRRRMDGSKIRMTDDNVLIQVIPEPESIAETGGLLVRPKSRSARSDGTIRAKVIETGPGHRPFPGKDTRVPTGVETGYLVVCRAQAGQVAEDYSLDLTKPRENSGCDFGEFRIIRADEIYAVIDDCTEDELRNTSTAAEEFSVEYNLG